jgi:hypothetical protein
MQEVHLLVKFKFESEHSVQSVNVVHNLHYDEHSIFICFILH